LIIKTVHRLIVAAVRTRNFIKESKRLRRWSKSLFSVDDGVVAGVRPILRPGSWTAHFVPLRFKVGRVRRASPIRIPVALSRKNVTIPQHLKDSFSRSGLVGPNRGKTQDYFVMDSRVEATEFLADVVLFRHDEKALYFDLERQEVLRVAHEAHSDAKLKIRDAFAHHVSSVRYQSESDGTLREPIVEGASLASIDGERGDAVRRKILLSLADLIAAEGGGRWRIETRSSMTPVLYGSAPVSGAEVVPEDIRRLFDAEAVPVVPAHGGLSNINILCTSDGGFVVIDFDTCHVAPFAHDALFLVSQSALSWSMGRFGAELNSVWEAAGLRPILWDAEKVRQWFLAREVVRWSSRSARVAGKLSPAFLSVEADEARRRWASQERRLVALLQG
jgi:hypothetical protein